MSKKSFQVCGLPSGWWTEDQAKQEAFQGTKELLENVLGIEVGDVTYLQPPEIAALFEAYIRGYEAFAAKGIPFKKANSVMLKALKDAVAAFKAM